MTPMLHINEKVIFLVNYFVIKISHIIILNVYFILFFSVSGIIKHKASFINSIPTNICHSKLVIVSKIRNTNKYVFYYKNYTNINIINKIIDFFHF